MYEITYRYIILVIRVYMKEFVGEFDYVINKPVYKLYNVATKILEKIR